MAETFLHGIEHLTIDEGSRSITTVRTSVIGIIGTAPDADAATFPLNTPVLVAGNRVKAAKLDTTGDGLGTLPAAIDSIFDQTGAVLVVIRVEAGTTDAQTIANVIGGVDGATGKYKGMQAFLTAESALGYRPRIIIAPGFTHTYVEDGVTAVTITSGGTGYSSSPTIAIDGTTGDGATASCKVVNGVITKVYLTNNGTEYTTVPTVTVTDTTGHDAVLTASIGDTGNPVVAELIVVLNSLRAIAFCDTAFGSDEEAIKWAGFFSSKRIMPVCPKIIKTDSDGNSVTAWQSPIWAGIQALLDNTDGFHRSPSNQEVSGITGLSREIPFVMGDTSSAANILNEQNISCIINYDGYRTWGNRTCSSDSKYQYLCVVRVNDIIGDSIVASSLWAQDRNITKLYVENVVEMVNQYLRYLTNRGYILGGTAWADPDLNTSDSIDNGHLYIDYDWTPAYPAEHITYRSHLVDDYIEEIFE